MTVCVLYCNEPPEDVDSCEAKSPHNINMVNGMSKTICGKVFFSDCYSDESENNVYLIIPNKARLNILTTVSHSEIALSYSVQYYDDVIYSGSTELDDEQLFKITIPAIKDYKYAYLHITHRDGKCVFPIVIC